MTTSTPHTPAPAPEETKQPGGASEAPARSAALPARSAALPARSEALLPAEDDPDGRFAVAEEVSLDQQSDAARRVGALPPDPVPGAGLPDALATTLGATPPAATELEDKLPPI